MNAIPEPPGYDTIRLEREGPISWLVLNRPERHTALSAAMLRELSASLAWLAADEATHVIVIRGEGRSFCSGYDVRDEGRNPSAPGADILSDLTRLQGNIRTFLEIWDLPKPVVAAVHGHCLAGATQLCLFCDITIVAEDATIGWPVIPLGGGYLSPLFALSVGPKRAKQMSYVVGSEITGETAADWGWANYAVPAADLLDDVRAMATAIARTPPELLRLKKAAINRVVELSGFRTAVLLGAETDAILHESAAVKAVRQLVADEGLKAAATRFREGGPA